MKILFNTADIYFPNISFFVKALKLFYKSHRPSIIW